MATARVTELRKQFEAANKADPYMKRDLIEDLMYKLDRENPGAKELMEKEKPLIAELMAKLRTREHEKELEHSTSVSEFGSVSDSSYAPLEGDNGFSEAPGFEMGVSPWPSLVKNPALAPKSSGDRPRVKSPLEKILSHFSTREEFRVFIAKKGASENFDFWMASHDCEHKARACASLAKKIINKLMKEIKATQGHPEQSHMDLALNSAVVAVRYELMLHKEETHEDVKQIVDQFVRDNAPQRVNLSTENRSALIRAVDSEDHGEGDILATLAHAQDEIRDLMERKFFDEFAQMHGF